MEEQADKVCKASTESLPRIQYHCLVANETEGRSKTDYHPDIDVGKKHTMRNEKGICSWPMKEVTHVELLGVAKPATPLAVA